MTHHIFRNPLISAAVTSSALAMAALLTAGCGPTSSSASSGSDSPGASGSSAAPVSASPSASGSGGAATAGATGTPSATTGGSGSSGTPGTARSDCTTDDLKATTGRGQGAAGSAIVPIVFTNKSGRTCSLRGFPGVSLANSGGPIGASASRDSSQSSANVTLAPGTKASALLKVADAQNYPSGTCKVDTSSFLLVYPPNETEAVDIPYKGSGCQNKSVKLLQVQPVVSGSGS